MVADPIQITSLKAPPPGFTWDPEERERERTARTSDHKFHRPASDPVPPPPTPLPAPIQEPKTRKPEADAWTEAQDAVIWQWAGLEPPSRIAERCSAVGPPRTKHATLDRAALFSISLRKRRRRVYEKTGWTGEEEALLRSLAGRVPVREITGRLNARFGTRRRLAGVQRHTNVLGLSTKIGGLLPAYELRIILGVGWREMKRLLHSGELVAARRSVGKGGDWGIAPDELAAYIRAHPERMHWQEMPEGRWREQARLASLRDPYVTMDEAVAATGVPKATMSRRLNDGLAPRAVRERGTWRIPTSELDLLRLPKPAKVRPPTVKDRLLAELGPRFRRCIDLADAIGSTETGIYTAVKALRRAGRRIEHRIDQGYRLRLGR
jgi:hypothetical protein